MSRRELDAWAQKFSDCIAKFLLWRAFTQKSDYERLTFELACLQSEFSRHPFDYKLYRLSK